MSSKPRYPTAFFIICLLVWFVSCKHDPLLAPGMPNDNTDDTLPNTNGGCSPDTTYFAQEVLPLIQSSCAKSGCHDAITHKEDLTLTSYSNIMASGIVKAGNPSGSKLVKVITITGEDRMPPSPNPSLTSGQIATIQKWISQGAQNNSCSEKGCDTVNVAYSTHIQPLIASYCVGCHSGANPGGQIDLTTYAGAKAIANDGRFVGAIMHAPGFAAMPKNGATLSDCQIRMVNLWIGRGTPQ